VRPKEIGKFVAYQENLPLLSFSSMSDASAIYIYKLPSLNTLNGMRQYNQYSVFQALSIGITKW